MCQVQVYGLLFVVNLTLQVDIQMCYFAWKYRLIQTKLQLHYSVHRYLVLLGVRIYPTRMCFAQLRHYLLVLHMHGG